MSPLPHGSLRRSQVVTTFGPGALMDLPTQGVLIAGLDHWGDPEKQGFTPVFEDRLTDKIAELLGRKPKLFMPPEASDDPQKSTQGMRAWQFPGWFVAQFEDPAQLARGVRARPLVSYRSLEKGKYRGADRKSHKVLPIRFVMACANGHIADLRWYDFAHREARDRACRRPLWLDEYGTSGDLSDIWVRCECGARQPLVIATQVQEGRYPLGFCDGECTWLGPNERALPQCGGAEGARKPNKLLVRSASNAYFPQVLSVIAIPDGDAALRRAVDETWSDLGEAEDVDSVGYEMKKKKHADRFKGISPAAVWSEVERRRDGRPETRKSIKRVEIETLLASGDELGEDVADGDFYARRLPLPSPARGPMRVIDRVVLVHRLREVMAQIGFTRFEPAVPDVDGELALGVARAPLSREPTWLPAVENRGEGVLLSFRREQLLEWLARPAVQAREAQLQRGFNAWTAAHPDARAKFPGAVYVMLHSLSHLLITAIALECGYSSSAIRERVYVGDGGYGILLYTGSFDAEGTLGGLVEAGRRIEHHLANALDLARLCSNDPVCAQHRPEHRQEERYLHGAACHGCLLIGETSCERRNEHLDRALVVATVEEQGAEFFVDEAP